VPVLTVKRNHRFRSATAHRCSFDLQSIGLDACFALAEEPLHTAHGERLQRRLDPCQAVQRVMGTDGGPSMPVSEPCGLCGLTMLAATSETDDLPPCRRPAALQGLLTLIASSSRLRQRRISFTDCESELLASCVMARVACRADTQMPPSETERSGSTRESRRRHGE